LKNGKDLLILSMLGVKGQTDPNISGGTLTLKRGQYCTIQAPRDFRLAGHRSRSSHFEKEHNDDKK
jgi:hypothetical protein